MVRPRKDEGLLSERVVFRLRPKEVADLKWAADQAGMHPADLTRIPLRAALAAGPAYFDDDIEQMQALIRGFNTKALIYPPLSLEWEAEVTDPELALAYCRAYNRWVVDFCSDSGGRLIPVAHITLADGQAAAQELERAVKAGAKGAFVAPYTITDKAHAHPDHDPLWAAAQDLGVPVGIHPVAEPPKRRVYQHMMEYIGSDKFFWASDFPHDDHTCDYIKALAELVAPMSEESRTNFLGANVARVYGLS